MLFLGAKVSQYALLPQGQVEATDRVQNMVAQMIWKVLETAPIQVLVKWNAQKEFH